MLQLSGPRVPLNAGTWTESPPFAAAGHAVVVIDLRGHGQSWTVPLLRRGCTRMGQSRTRGGSSGQTCFSSRRELPDPRSRGVGPILAPAAFSTIRSNVLQNVEL